MTSGVEQGPRQSRSAPCMLWLVLAAAWFATMPMRVLLDPDEGRYAEVPREMLAQGDWITPRLDGLKYFEKPPLQYWATAAAYSVFGVNEWTARLWTVGLGFLCLPMVFAWTSRLYGRAAGVAALIALAVSPYFELIAHLNLLDAGFTFWLAGTMFAFALSQCAPRGSPGERRWILTSWAAAALAVLTKGIVVGVLAGATLFLYSLLDRDWTPWRRLHLRWGLPLFLLIAAPWFVAVGMRNPSFAKFFFVHEHFARFLTTVHQRVEPWWYFGALLLIASLPWLAALGPACRAAWLESSSDRSFKPLKFLLIFSVVTVLFFSVSSSKLAPYIAPMLPPLAAIVGVRLGMSPTFVRTAVRFNLVLIVIVSAGFILYCTSHFGFVPRSTVPWTAGAVAAVLLGALFAGNLTSGPRAVAATAAGAILAWQCLLCAYSELGLRSSYKMIMSVKSHIGPQTELFSIGQYRETLSPYLQRTVPPVDFAGELEFGLSEEPGARLTAEQFLARWKSSGDAVAFVEPQALDAWRRRGMPGRVIGGDDSTLVVSRL